MSAFTSLEFAQVEYLDWLDHLYAGVRRCESTWDQVTLLLNDWNDEAGKDDALVDALMRTIREIGTCANCIEVGLDPAGLHPRELLEWIEPISKHLLDAATEFRAALEPNATAGLAESFVHVDAVSKLLHPVLSPGSPVRELARIIETRHN